MPLPETYHPSQRSTHATAHHHPHHHPHSHGRALPHTLTGAYGRNGRGSASASHSRRHHPNNLSRSAAASRSVSPPHSFHGPPSGLNNNKRPSIGPHPQSYHNSPRNSAALSHQGQQLFHASAPCSHAASPAPSRALSPVASIHGNGRKMGHRNSQIHPNSQMYSFASHMSGYPAAPGAPTSHHHFDSPPNNVVNFTNGYHHNYSPQQQQQRSATLPAAAAVSAHDHSYTHAHTHGVHVPQGGGGRHGMSFMREHVTRTPEQTLRSHARGARPLTQVECGARSGLGAPGVAPGEHGYPPCGDTSEVFEFTKRPNPFNACLSNAYGELQSPRGTVNCCYCCYFVVFLFC